MCGQCAKAKLKLKLKLAEQYVANLFASNKKLQADLFFMLGCR
jgi:hypothetical protein